MGCAFCGTPWQTGENGREVGWWQAKAYGGSFHDYPFRSERNPVPEMKFSGLACMRCAGIITTHFGRRQPGHPEYSEKEYKKIAVQYQLIKSK